MQGNSVPRSLLPIDKAYGESDLAARQFRAVLLVFYTLSGIVYLTWRSTVFNPDAWTLSAIFYSVELGGFFGSLLLFFVTFQRRVRMPRPAPNGLTVDVLISTLNEDIDVVRRTLVAALAIRYPHQTWLLDDGNRPTFRAMAKELGCRYLARNDNRGAKAGNLNHALGKTSGDFIALFDADHCADPIFLDRLLGYFDDPDVCFVQSPQDYYNLNSYQHGNDRHSKLIWHEQSGFHHVEQPGRDQFDAATLCGCSCILRRSHVFLVGGFPEETVTEDMHLAVRLQKHGLKSVYHDEPLAFGIAPPDLRGFLTQRLRWGEGNMQVCRIERLPFARRLTWRQNMGYLLLGFAYIDAWRKLILYSAPIYTVITETTPVYGMPLEFVFFFVPFLIFGTIAYWEFYAGFGRLFRTEINTMARLGAGLMATWGLFRRQIRFRVSSKRLISRYTLHFALPQVAILLGGIFAIGCAAFNFYEYTQGLRPISIPLEILALLTALVCYNCVLAWSVVSKAINTSRTDERSYAFDVQLPIRLSTPHQTLIGWTDLISLSQARLCDRVGLEPASGIVSAELFIPGSSISLNAKVKPHDADHLEIEFNWSCHAHRDRLDQSLHAGRWHRVITGRYEAAPSPLELLGLRPTPDTRRPEARSTWTAVLLRTASDPQNERLGYMRGEGRLEIIMFGMSPDLFEVVASPDSRLVGGWFESAGAPETILLDEIALECCFGLRHSLRKVEEPTRYLACRQENVEIYQT